jgi:hypothetical protein
MTPVLLVLALLLMQSSPDLPDPRRRPVERVRTMEEADVDSLAPTTGARVPVRIEVLEGVPVPVREREAFLKGFRGAFQERELPTERVAKTTGAVKPGALLRNGLRLAEGEDEKGAWSARVRLEWFTPTDSGSVRVDSLARAGTGRGARVTVTVGWPEGPRAGPPPLPRTEWLRFPAGYAVDAAYYQQAGRQVGFLTLEAVQRAKGDLGDDRRLRLEDTRRITPAAGR